MKKLTLLIAFLFVAMSYAQMPTKDEMSMIQDIFGSEKKEIIAENIDLSGVDAAKFWELYDEYEVARKVNGQERIKLLSTYASTTSAVSNQMAEDMLQKAIVIRSASENTLMKYTKKIKKATNPVVAAQFYQIEQYIADGIRFSILDNMDFIQNK
ncbi:hypothetical protein [Namhaeicola litoreus]|uniref:Uncharacterized protein n=1 Tax=Namhaeicola litoreus TaxID=1052145 RepID=A0ABW3Y294_9FLAO